MLHLSGLLCIASLSLAALASSVGEAPLAGRPPAVFSLRYTALSAGQAAEHHRRRRRSLAGVNASAQLELYGSVRDNGVFTVHLSLGTPGQAFDVIVDTGSTLAYVPCQDCGAGCGSHEARAISLPRLVSRG
jgi:hypothetical protein